MPLALSKNKLILIIIGVVLLIGVIILFSLGQKPPLATPPSIVIWGTDKEDVLTSSIKQYQQTFARAEVIYKQIDAANYDDTLISALAAGTGPDVFFISNRSLPKFRNILTPMNQVAIQYSLADFKNAYPTVATQDFIWKNNIYAMPMSLDTLVLLYNRDILDQASIPNPPKTWAEVQDIVPKLRIMNAQGQIQRASIALGGADTAGNLPGNVNHATDILSLLMLQDATQMTDQTNGAATFANANGQKALDFYMQFSNPASQVYTWNGAQQTSFDSFAAGKTAMILAYKSDIPSIKAKGPFLNLEVAPAPQVSELAPINYPQYWGLTVSAQAANKSATAVNDAWNFIGSLAANESNAKAYMTSSGNPPALRSLISSYASDNDFGVFVRQALSARSWYIPDYARIVDIFDLAVSRVLGGQSDSVGALREAQGSVSALLKKQL